MASKNSVIKFAIFFFVLLTTTIVDMCGTSAFRDMPLEARLVKWKLLTPSILGGCDNSCSANSDCGGFTLCQWCWEKTNPFDGSTYKTCTILP
ncbi:unnamed protein product [Withania somnifera]